MRVSYYLLFITFSIFTGANCFAQVKVVNAFPELQFEAPVDIQYARQEDSRLFVAERNGRILVFENDSNAVNTAVFLDISNKTATTGEGGLLGFAFHPNYQANGQFFVYYTKADPFRSVISRFQVSEDNPDSAGSSSEETILEINQPYSNHNAGQIRFGPDGYLYIALGDGGGSGDPEENGEDRTTLLGSILRINVDETQGDLNYSIPADNPFAGNSEGYREEIYAYGFRNPYRFSFDRQTGELWVGDVGQNRLEEINVVKAGLNYGWNTMEGSQCFDPESGCDTSNRELPVFEYDHSVGNSITGGFVYRGNAVPELQGRYVYADFGSGRIWSIEWNGENTSDNQLLTRMNENSIVTFGEDQNGELLTGSFDGNLYRFESQNPVTAELTDDLPNEIRLNQNYPNPFNPSTEISFHLPEATYVELNVYDILGQEITTLVSGYRSEGEHHVQFDASDLSGGIYIYSLQTGEERITRKMTLMK